MDASVLMEVLLGSERGRRAEGHFVGHAVHLPQLAYLEVASTVRGWLRGGLLTQVRADQLIADLPRFPAKSWPHERLVHRVWGLRDNMSAYDASYVALAESLGATLLTTDARLAVAVRAHAACPVIEVV